jgi:polyisoprenoid-binding protein YceI
MRRWILLAVAAVLVLVVGAFAYEVVGGLNEPGPPELAENTDGARGRDGQYRVRPRSGSLVGYRVRERVFGFGLRAAVGRTGNVEGRASLTGRHIHRASFTADMTTLISDQSQRDAALRSRGIDTDTYPESSFELSRPAAIVPAGRERTRARIRGRLTLHGRTNDVALDARAQWNRGALEVVGAGPIEFARFDIPPPSVAGVVRVEDHGQLEFRLRLEPAAG